MMKQKFRLVAFVSLLLLAISGRKADAQQRPPIPEGTKAERDIPYVEKGHERQKLDLYLPARPKAERPPLVVWIHGGGWAKGSKDGIGGCRWVLEEGYALASVGYRLTDGAAFPAQLEDCKAGIGWLREHAEEKGFDGEKIVVWGGSAGGHLVSMLGTTGEPDDESDDLDGVINWFGPSQLLTMQEQRLLPTRLDANAPDSFESRLVGGTLQEHPEKARAASPITHVTSDDAPFLIMHGDRDALVPLEQSRRLTAALEKAGVDVKLHVLEGAGHGGREFQGEEARKVIRDFLRSSFED
jgi:acetyl esterase/lipase